jgi:hypothetical protein
MVTWLSGPQGPHERNLQGEKGWTPRYSDQGQHHGRCHMGKRMMRRAAKVIDLKLDQFALTLDCTPTILTAKMDVTAIPPCTSKQAAHIPLSVNMHNVESIQSSHTCDLLLTYLLPQARKAHVLPDLVCNSLISVGQLCDRGCDITFKKEAVSVMKVRKCIMLGSQDPHSGLWRVHL